METLQKIALVFTIFGGITLGLIGIFDWNLVEAIFSNMKNIVRIIYGIIGVCALINIKTLFIDFRENKNTTRY